MDLTKENKKKIYESIKKIGEYIEKNIQPRLKEGDNIDIQLFSGFSIRIYKNSIYISTDETSYCDPETCLLRNTDKLNVAAFLLVKNWRKIKRILRRKCFWYTIDDTVWNITDYIRDKKYQSVIDNWHI